MILNRVINYSTKLRIATTGTANRLSLVKQFHQTAARHAEKEIKPGGDASRHIPDIWDKRILVLMKKYPNVESVPGRVPNSQMEKARSQIRIRVNIIMILLTVVGSYTFYTWGKKEAQEGDSIYLKRQKEFSPDKAATS